MLRAILRVGRVGLEALRGCRDRLLGSSRWCVGAGNGRRVELRSAQGGRFVRECPGEFVVLCFLWLKGRGSRSWSAERGGELVGERRRGLELRVGLGGFEDNGVVVLGKRRCLILRL
jgi:hypothetical protein